VRGLASSTDVPLRSACADLSAGPGVDSGVGLCAAVCVELSVDLCVEP